MPWLILFLIRMLPALWVGWAVKGLAEWYRPERMSYAAMSDRNATILLWSAVACLVIAFAWLKYPDKPLLGSIFQLFRDLWDWLKANWKSTNSTNSTGV